MYFYRNKKMRRYLQLLRESRDKDSTASNSRESKRGGSRHREEKYESSRNDDSRGSSRNRYSRDTGMSAAQIEEERQQKQMTKAIQESTAVQTEYEKASLMQQQEYIAQNREIAASQQAADAKVQSQMNNQILMNQLAQPGGPTGGHGMGEEGEKKGFFDRFKPKKKYKGGRYKTLTEEEAKLRVEDESSKKAKDSIKKDIDKVSEDDPKVSTSEVEDAQESISKDISNVAGDSEIIGDETRVAGKTLSQEQFMSSKYRDVRKVTRMGEFAPKKPIFKRKILNPKTGLFEDEYVDGPEDMEKDVAKVSKSVPKYTAESIEQGLKDGSMRQLTEDEIKSGKYDKVLKRGKYAPKKGYNKRFSDLWKDKDKDPKKEAETAKKTIQDDVKKTAGEEKTSDTPTTTSQTTEDAATKTTDSKTTAQNNINNDINETTGGDQQMSFEEFQKEQEAGTLPDEQQFETVTGQSLDPPESASQTVNNAVDTTDDATDATTAGQDVKDATYLEDVENVGEDVGEDVL